MEIQQARPEDVQFVRKIAEAAYRPYVRRIGRKPAPMVADFASRISDGQVWVAAEFTEIMGYVVLVDRADALLVENLAVAPERHGLGLGRSLLEFAEAEATRRGHGRLTLFTNVKMRESQAFYTALGWREAGRRTEDGFDRVYFEKIAAPAQARRR